MYNVGVVVLVPWGSCSGDGCVPSPRVWGTKRRAVTQWMARVRPGPKGMGGWVGHPLRAQAWPVLRHFSNPDLLLDVPQNPANPRSLSLSLECPWSWGDICRVPRCPLVYVGQHLMRRAPDATIKNKGKIMLP